MPVPLRLPVPAAAQARYAQNPSPPSPQRRHSVVAWLNKHLARRCHQLAGIPQVRRAVQRRSLDSSSLHTPRTIGGESRAGSRAESIDMARPVVLFGAILDTTVVRVGLAPGRVEEAVLAEEGGLVAGPDGELHGTLSAMAGLSPGQEGFCLDGSPEESAGSWGRTPRVVRPGGLSRLWRGSLEEGRALDAGLDGAAAEHGTSTVTTPRKCLGYAAALGRGGVRCSWRQSLVRRRARLRLTRYLAMRYAVASSTCMFEPELRAQTKTVQLSL